MSDDIERAVLTWAEEVWRRNRDLGAPEMSRELWGAEFTLLGYAMALRDNRERQQSSEPSAPPVPASDSDSTEK